MYNKHDITGNMPRPKKRKGGVIMREKNTSRRDHVLLIRVNKKEKALAETESKASGENVSEYFRRILREAASGGAAQKSEYIFNNHKKIIKEYKKILTKIKNGTVTNRPVQKTKSIYGGQARRCKDKTHL